MNDSARSFHAVIVVGPKRRVFIPLPFAPDDAWGPKPEHHVAGTVDGAPVRAVVESLGDGYAIVVGPAWRRNRDIGPGDRVAVELSPEGPQRDDLPSDLRLALDADQRAGEFFDGIAQFYRNAYVRWIEATKRRPEVRAQRIADVVSLLADGKKERPREVPED